MRQSYDDEDLQHDQDRPDDLDDAWRAAHRSLLELQWAISITQTMASNVDDTQALLGLADGLVPRLADVAVVDVVDDRDNVTRLGGASAPRLRIDLDEVLSRPGSRPAGSGGSRTTATTMLRRTVRLQARAVDDPSVLDAASRQVLRDVGAREVLIAPLVGRGHLCGVIRLISVDRGPYSARELSLVQEIASRAGLALHNARLFRAEAQAASTVQQALLPSSLHHSYLAAAAAYRPSRERQAVGGDWYDVIPSWHVAGGGISAPGT